MDLTTTTVAITLIGGPAALIELGGFRLLTDPTFDDPGDYQLPHVTLRKAEKPALSAAQIGVMGAVLLSHGQHADELEQGFRALGHGHRLRRLEPGVQTVIPL
jgi:L-ascorbate metabolism protein UlaG (beta-lactamase superfamily)